MVLRYPSKVGLLVWVGLASACASPRSANQPIAPLYLPDSSAAVRLAVYGGLEQFLLGSRRTTSLEEFLYGPDDHTARLLRNPQGLTVVGDNLLVCDQGYPGIVSIDLKTGSRRLWGDSDHQPRCPIDITVDSSARVYVADATRRSVLVYDEVGRFLRELAPSLDPDRDFRPTAVQENAGILYVCDTLGRLLHRYDLTDDRWLEALVPPDGHDPLIAPTGLAWSPDRQILYVCDTLQAKVFRVQRDGHWLDPIGRSGRREGEFVRPKQVAVGSSGLLFVADAGRQSVLVFDDSGGFLLEIHERPPVWKGLTLPVGLEVVAASTLPAAGRALTAAGQPVPLEYVIVSDALGSTSLTLMGVFDQNGRPPSNTE